jgi:Amt family ammonium transporter
MGPQIIAVLATIFYSLAMSLIILKILDIIPGLGLRVSEQEEDTGLDISNHGERSYTQDGAD